MDHPLVPWLKRRKLKPYRFADQIKMPRRTLYSHLSGKVRNPSLEAMREIEKGTDGKVSLKAQDAWFASLAQADGADDGPEEVA
jgi:predicted transcriptional regulator